MAYRSTETKWKAFFSCCAIAFTLLYLQFYRASDGLEVSLVLGLFGGLILYPIFGGLIGGFIQKEEDEKNNKKYELAQAKQREIEAAQRIHNDRYQMDLDMERKRRELEIEFEHYYKIAMLNAQIDEGKMRKLEQMKRDFAQEKTHGIDALNSQIARLRQMAYED
jgi:hypothetical protein